MIQDIGETGYSSLSCNQALIDTLKLIAFDSGGPRLRVQNRFEPFAPDELIPHGELTFSVPKGSEVSLMGSRGEGGNVFLVKAPGKEPEVWKDYADIENACRDERLLNILRKVAQKPGYQGLNVVEKLSSRGKLYKFKYVHGRSLLKLEWDARQAKPGTFIAAETERLRGIYLSKLRATFAAIREEYPDFVQTTRYFGYFTGPDGRKCKILLHADNVQINPTNYEMTIIDPF